MSSAPRGLAPRKGLELSMLKVGRTRPSMEPHHGPQAGKSRYPGSQNAKHLSSYHIYPFECCSCVSDVQKEEGDC